VEGNMPDEAFNRFQVLKLIEPELKVICFFDRIGRSKNQDGPMTILEWDKGELETTFARKRYKSGSYGKNPPSGCALVLNAGQ